jgi:hypothetical protein
MMPPVAPLAALLLASLLATPAMTEPGPHLHPAPVGTRLRFELSVRPGLLDKAEDGRLLVILGAPKGPEPRRGVGDTSRNAAPIFARDVDRFGPDSPALIDERAIGFPLTNLGDVAVGDYSVQAVFDRARDLRSLNSPGNLYSEPIKVHVDPSRGEAVRIELTKEVPAESLSRDTDSTRFLKVPSKLLSEFHGRSMFLRAGVILPRDFANEPNRPYPLRVHIGGYGSRYYVLPRVPAEPDAPRFVTLVLDGAGPLGDPYQVNSANLGPYGDALIKELIPHVEKTFRCIGEPHARVLDGGSTGGWVAAALQIFYPDVFNGAWASCPDSLDFRSFQLVNIYEDTNAYVNKAGFERPAARNRLGDVQCTMRHECQLENALGKGDSWTMSGGQWGAWNATYGPKGPDGRPVPIWDPKTGEINKSVVEHWKQYDLRLVVEKDWSTLAPKLRGKLHIWVGEADDYFLNNAVHRFDDALSKLNPPHGGTIAYGPGQTHCWQGISEREMMNQMAAAVSAGQRAAPAPAR